MQILWRIAPTLLERLIYSILARYNKKLDQDSSALGTKYITQLRNESIQQVHCNVGRRNLGFPFLVQHIRSQGFPPINTVKAHTTVLSLVSLAALNIEDANCVYICSPDKMFPDVYHRLKL